jgi:tetratricopeptide (TPR) repeat protein
LELNPRCLRIIDSMCAENAPGMLNRLVEMGPEIYSTTLLSELLGMPGLPKTIQEKIHDARRPGGNPEGRASICQALIDEGAPDNDQMELSLAALGRMIQETTFVHIFRKAEMMAVHWSVDTSDYTSEIQPLIADHRFRPLIDFYGAANSSTKDKARKALASISWEDLTVTEFPLYWLEKRWQSRNKDPDLTLLGVFRLNMDVSSFDHEAWLAMYDGTLTGQYLDQEIELLQTASPESPWIVRNAIVNQWDPDMVLNWEESRGDYPSIAFALGKKHAQFGEIEDAIRCFNRYLEVSPDRFGYETVADLYKSQKNDEKWLETMKAFLDKPEVIHFEHSLVQFEIAVHYMSNGKYAEALTYANASKDSGGPWGHIVAAKANTRLGRFKEAEALLIQDIKSFARSPIKWLTWCVETGHGDRRAATQAMRDYFERGMDGDGEALTQMAFLHVLEGNRAEAIELLKARVKKAPGVVPLLHIMVLADEQDDRVTRDQAINQLSELKDEKPKDMAFAGELVKAYTEGKMDLPAVNTAISKAEGARRIRFALLMARYQLKHDQKDSAIEFIKQCYIELDHDCPEEILVYQMSRELGMDPLVLRKAASAADK